jgi:hypothetical protein
MVEGNAPLRALKVLFVASNPPGTDALSLDEEFRGVDQRLRVGSLRERVRLLPRLAARPDDLMEGLLEEDPDVVHFSGHGQSNGALVFTGSDGAAHEVTVEAMAALFRAVENHVRVVLFNACFSDLQAEAISAAVGCAIGMSKPITDGAASIFAAAFYRGLAHGRSVAEAFEQGRAALRVEGLSAEADTPRLLARANVDPAKLVLGASLGEPKVAPQQPSGAARAQVVSAARVDDLPIVVVRLLAREVLKVAPDAARRDATATVTADGATYSLSVLQAPARDRATLGGLLHAVEMMDALETDLRFVKQQQQLSPFAQFTPYFQVQAGRRTEELAQNEIELRTALKVFCA